MGGQTGSGGPKWPSQCLLPFGQGYGACWSPLVEGGSRCCLPFIEGAVGCLGPFINVVDGGGGLSLLVDGGVGRS